MAYLSSSQVKSVYPTAYRNSAFDLEADNTTEYNMVNMVNRLGRRSFVVSYNYNNAASAADKIGLQVSLGGYMFEMSNAGITKLLSEANNADIYLYIRVASAVEGRFMEAELVNADDDTDTSHDLDNSQNNFRGLGYSFGSAPAAASHSLKILTYKNNSWIVPSTSYVILDSKRVGNATGNVDGPIADTAAEVFSTKDLHSETLEVTDSASLKDVEASGTLDVTGAATFGSSVTADGDLKSKTVLKLKNSNTTYSTLKANSTSAIEIKLPAKAGTLSRITKLFSYDSAQTNSLPYVKSMSYEYTKDTAKALIGASLSGSGKTHKYMHVASTFAGSEGTTSSIDGNTDVASSDHTHTFTPAGTIEVSDGVAVKSITDHTYTPAGEVTSTFSGTENTSVVTNVTVNNQGSVTMAGSVSNGVLTITATHTGTKLSLTQGYTPEGTVSSTFSGTEATISHEVETTNTTAEFTGTQGTTGDPSESTAVASSDHTHDFTPAGTITSTLSKDDVTDGIKYVEDLSFDTLSTTDDDFLTPDTVVTVTPVDKHIQVEEVD